MRLFNLFENDDHAEHLSRTGFWGKEGAGLIFLAQDTNRLCLSLRSHVVTEPRTWSTWGGAMDKGETPLQTATREAREETMMDVDLLGMHLVHENVIPGKFKYTTFIGIVATEFHPIVDNNWEVDGYEWCDFGEWPNPLHHGMATTLDDKMFIDTYNKLIQR